ARGPRPHRLPDAPPDLRPRGGPREAGGARVGAEGALRGGRGADGGARPRRRAGPRRLRLPGLQLPARLSPPPRFESGPQRGARGALRALSEPGRRDPRGAGPQRHPRHDPGRHRRQARHRLHPEHREGEEQARRRRLPGGIHPPPHAGRPGPGSRRGGGDDAAEVDLLLPQAAHRDRLQPFELTSASWIRLPSGSGTSSVRVFSLSRLTSPVLIPLPLSSAIRASRSGTISVTSPYPARSGSSTTYTHLASVSRQARSVLFGAMPGAEPRNRSSHSMAGSSSVTGIPANSTSTANSASVRRWVRSFHGQDLHAQG